jgi:membrane protease YdiL (CAAX protease family)
VPIDIQPALLICGVLLGVGDMGLSTFLCNVGIHVANEIAPADGPSRLDQWLVVARGGWMRYYLRTMDLAPLPFALLSILLYVAVEEIVFRGVLINYLQPLGAVVATVLSALLFAVVQVFHMPGWRAAMFPVIGALVVGVLHGALYIAVPNLIPLILAHLVFLVVSLV